MQNFSREDEKFKENIGWDFVHCCKKKKKRKKKKAKKRVTRFTNIEKKICPLASEISHQLNNIKRQTSLSG